jgi:hypothetical protein
VASSLLAPPSTTPPPLPASPRDDAEALIEEARRRQRKRRLVLAAVLVGLVALGSLTYFGIFRSEASPSLTGRSAPVINARTLQLHLAGFGTPPPSPIDTGPCPQGRTLIAIRSAAGAHLGSVLGCMLTIQKTDVPNYGVRRIIQTVRETYTLPGGTIVTKETQMIRFARDQRHTTASFRGRVLRGSGRYLHRRGTVIGGGHGLNGNADWIVNIHFR